MRPFLHFFCFQDELPLLFSLAGASAACLGERGDLLEVRDCVHWYQSEEADEPLVTLVVVADSVCCRFHRHPYPLRSTFLSTATPPQGVFRG